MTEEQRKTATNPGFVIMDGETWSVIPDFHRMPPFLMSVPGESDLWMYLSSRGGLTAGRTSPENSLFPYETVDKLHRSHYHTGSVTLLRVDRSGKEALWEPFAEAIASPETRTALYRSRVGNRILFESTQPDLELRFRSEWSTCDEFGIVRTVTLENLASSPLRVHMLDGLRNVLPHGAPLALYQQSSSLVDAYKRADTDPETGLAVIALTARITDRAEAAEELRANLAWSPQRGPVHLREEAVEEFRLGSPFGTPASTLTGSRACYLKELVLEIPPGDTARSRTVADAGLGHVAIAALDQRLRSGEDLDAAVDRALDRAAQDLLSNVASSDGLQLGGSPQADMHHFANVLYNNMRGGVLPANNDAPVADFLDFLDTRNRPVLDRHRDCLSALGTVVSLDDLDTLTAETGDADLLRLAYEYLPITFGRRHGDPSRPWNRFSIRVKKSDGSPTLAYEGNWRDIFQNWEALAVSFPRILPRLVAKFVNASTVDGFNPYRISRDGVDWEVADPDDPWSYIGYWGDHQIIYLLKLLEALDGWDPVALAAMLDQAVFSYADVPYRIRPYEDLVKDPHDSIRFDVRRAEAVDGRVAALGTDGRLLADPQGSVLHVTLMEKLLVPLLSKLSNLVPDGGIWMNTQRPEWNDANNALAGNGVSMVTLGYLRRYVAFLEDLLREAKGTFAVSNEVATWLRDITKILSDHDAAGAGSDDTRRRALLDALGKAFSSYRDGVYAHGLSTAAPVTAAEVQDLCRAAREHLDHALHANQRADGLYHAYNILVLGRTRDTAELERLPEMLEGQVAALSSGHVGPGEAADMIDALFAGPMYRTNQRSFMLYPERELRPFLDRNVVPGEGVDRIPLLGELLIDGDRSVLERDATGRIRFHADFSQAADVSRALDRLAAEANWTEAVRRDRAAVLSLFEEVFRHHSFTGRSGTMYAYEGLGSIYWHMVAKLLLAVQEIVVGCADSDTSPEVIDRLVRHYFRIRGGLGFKKTAGEYGAFPVDPYSHTPPGGGARQPGMTGQVKEEILTRFGELGVRVKAGRIRFRPGLLRDDDFLREPGVFHCLDVAGAVRETNLPAGSLAFTLCQVPVVYYLTDDDAWLRVERGEDASTARPGNTLNAAESDALSRRDGTVTAIAVGVPRTAVRPAED